MKTTIAENKKLERVKHQIPRFVLACLCNFIYYNNYLPKAHLKPKDKATPFLPPFLIIVWKNPVNLSPQRF